MSVARQTVRVYDVLASSPDDIARLRAEMMSLQVLNYQSADGAAAPETRQRLESYVSRVLSVGPDRLHSGLAIVYEGGRPISTVHGYIDRVPVGDRAVRVIFGNFNTAPSHRGQKVTMRAVQASFISAMRSYATSRMPCYVSAVAMSPVLYKMCHAALKHTYPSPYARPTDEMLAVFDAVYPGARDNGGLVRMPVATALEARGRRYIEETDDPFIRYFVERNPEFEQGWALPFIARFRSTDAAYAATTILRRAARRRIQHAKESFRVRD